jgi:hypothetical protein
MALMIFYSYQNNKEMKAVNPKITEKEMGQVDTWVGELESNNNTLTAKTKFYVEKGTGETLKKVDELNGLRIDLQKVIGVGKKEEAPTYVFINSKKPATKEDYLAFQAKPKSAKVMEVAGKLIYEALWSLFAVQKVKTYNRVFHLNNLVDALTTDQWKRIFRTTLEGSCTAIITNDKNKLPSGYDADQLMTEDEG